MARLNPIQRKGITTISGQGGLGSSSTSTQIDLGGIMKLFQGLEDRKREEEKEKKLQSLLGLLGQSPQAIGTQQAAQPQMGAVEGPPSPQQFAGALPREIAKAPAAKEAAFAQLGGLLPAQSLNALANVLMPKKESQTPSFQKPFEIDIDGKTQLVTLDSNTGNLKELGGALPKDVGTLSLGEQNNLAKGLRNDYLKISKDFSTIASSFSRIEASAKDPSAAGDLALIFNYMKMLDPGSVVRESEFATAENAASVPERVRKTWNKVLRGEKLGDEQRFDFTDRANRLFEKASKNQKKIETQFSEIAKRKGLNPKDIVIDLSPAIDEKKQRIRQTVEGYIIEEE